MDNPASDSDVSSGGYNTDTEGNKEFVGTTTDTQYDAAAEYSSDSFQETKKRRSEKGKKKNGQSWLQDFANAAKPYSKTTFINRVSVSGMKSFLEQAPFNIDVEAEYPEHSRMSYHDADGKPQSRGEAMADKCRELQQLLINDRKSREAEVAGQQTEAERFIRGDRTCLIPSIHNLFPGWPGSLPDSAFVPDSKLTALARANLQCIRHRAETKINEAYTMNQQIVIEEPEYILDRDDQPLLSARVQQLVQNIVNARIRGQRLRMLHVAESGGQRFQIHAEYQSFRDMLRHELEDTLDLESNIDCLTAAQKLVVEEFPPQL